MKFTTNRTNNIYEFHPLAEIFPLMDKLEFSSLINSMELHGYNSNFPILLFEGKILDGRNRYRASLEVDVEPCYIEFQGTYEEAEVYNMDANMHRRHFSKPQKAMMAAKAMQASRESEEKNLSGAKASLIYGVSTGYIKKALRILSKDSEIAEHVLNGTMQIKEAEYRIEQIQEARTPNEYDGMDASDSNDYHENHTEPSQTSIIMQEFHSNPEETAQRVIDIQTQYSELIRKLKECEERHQLSVT